MTIPAEARNPASSALVTAPAAASRRQATTFGALAYGWAYAWIETSAWIGCGGRSRASAASTTSCRVTRPGLAHHVRAAAIQSRLW